MYKQLLFILFVLLTQQLFSQEHKVFTETSNEIFKELEVDSIASFKGGRAQMMQFLAKNIRYPDDAIKKNISGRVLVNFTIEKDGSISDAHVVKNTTNNTNMELEALRVVNSFPKWIPAYKNGQPVRSTYSLPITFKLD